MATSNQTSISNSIRTLILLNHQSFLLAQKLGKEMQANERLSSAEKILLGVDAFNELERCLNARGFIIAYAPAVAVFIVLEKR